MPLRHGTVVMYFVRKEKLWSIWLEKIVEEAQSRFTSRILTRRCIRFCSSRSACTCPIFGWLRMWNAIVLVKLAVSISSSIIVEVGKGEASAQNTQHEDSAYNTQDLPNHGDGRVGEGDGRRDTGFLLVQNESDEEASTLCFSRKRKDECAYSQTGATLDFKRKRHRIHVCQCHGCVINYETKLGLCLGVKQQEGWQEGCNRWSFRLRHTCHLMHSFFAKEAK